MTICICCSPPYFKEVEKIVKKYKSIKFLTPTLNYSGFINEKSRKKLTLKHFKRIDKCNLVYLYNPDGKIGSGTIFEAGYAIAKGKKIFSFAKVKDEAVVGFIKVKFLKELCI